MTEPPLPAPQLDAEIARRVFGLDVLGLAWGYDCEDVVLEWSETEREWWSLYPVVLGRYGCRCGEPAIIEGEKVFGHDFLCLEAVPPYSADIAAAWTVIEAMEQQGYVYEIGSATVGHAAVFVKTMYPETLEIRHAYSTSPALAICRAALKALEAANG